MNLPENFTSLVTISCLRNLLHVVPYHSWIKLLVIFITDSVTIGKLLIMFFTFDIYKMAVKYISISITYKNAYDSVI
jgi:Na+-translocating ferredoxin:NAD+ oxidoreductase RnfE subunit